jgi:hypothetical protein
MFVYVYEYVYVYVCEFWTPRGYMRGFTPASLLLTGVLAMKSFVSRRVCAAVVLTAVLLVQGGCVKGLVRVPFDVARYAAIQSAKAPIDMAEIGARGVVDAVLSE